jgi:hypothetical protein
MNIDFWLGNKLVNEIGDEAVVSITELIRSGQRNGSRSLFECRGVCSPVSVADTTGNEAGIKR